MIRLCFVLLATSLVSYQKPETESPVFDNVPKLYPISPGIIDEASGIADSYANPGFLWVELDSDNPPVLHLLKHDGKHGHTVFLKGIQNRDWEDIAVSAGPVASKKYLY